MLVAGVYVNQSFMPRYRVKRSIGKRSCLLFWSAMILTAVSSCGPGRVPGPAQVFSDDQNLGSGTAPADSLSCSVFLDATLSMEGFVEVSAKKQAAGTRYEQVMEGIRRALTTGWPRSNIEFQRFGTQIEKSPVDPVAALRPSFYENPDFKKITKIELPLEQAAPGKLVLIITDLFQDQSDIAVLIAALKQHAIGRFTVGIIGIRSSFRGEIYDITAAHYHVHYEGFRPFYVLAVGPTMDVARFLQEFRRTLNLSPPEIQMVMVSPSPVPIPFGFGQNDSGVLEVREPLRTASEFAPSNVIELELPRHRSGKPEFSASIPFGALRFGLTIDPNEFAWRVSSRL
jgi:hypothetical protein